MIVYFHRNPITYEIFYAGIGTRKWRSYEFNSGRNPYWQNYVAKYGNPVVQIVHENVTKEIAHYWEKFYIKLLGRKTEDGQLTNITEGGDHTPVIPPESRLRCNAALVKWINENPEKNPMKRPEIVAKFSGDNNSSKRPEVRAKLKKANTGKKASAETRLKQSLLKLGKPSNRKNFKHSAETIQQFKIINKEIASRPDVRAKLSKANKGRRNVKNSVSVQMVDLKTGNIIKTFTCITDALNIFGKLRSGNISLVCNNKRKSAFGYGWKYLSAT